MSLIEQQERKILEDKFRDYKQKIYHPAPEYMSVLSEHAFISDINDEIIEGHHYFDDWFKSTELCTLIKPYLNINTTIKTMLLQNNFSPKEFTINELLTYAKENRTHPTHFVILRSNHHGSTRGYEYNDTLSADIYSLKIYDKELFE